VQTTDAPSVAVGETVADHRGAAVPGALSTTRGKAYRGRRAATPPPSRLSPLRISAPGCVLFERAPSVRVTPKAGLHLGQRNDMSNQPLPVPSSAREVTDPITIDFLFLDLTSCTRCIGTDQNLESALEIVREVLAAAGALVEVRKTLVETADQARELRFVSSPTLRVNGREIALELKEGPCGSEACSCGDGEQIACRVWSYRGQEYLEAPVGLVVDAVLGELYGGIARPRSAAPGRYELLEKLEAFFAAKSQGSSEQSACCSPAEQASCCGPSAKADCCGPSTATGCGCR
jgi:hypothetical protein